MSISTTIPPSEAAAVEPPGARNRGPVYMVLGCTIFAAVAQVLLKFGALHPMPALHPGNLSSILAFIGALTGNLPLVFGYGLHACNAMLLILALREGQLSLLYPVYALSYIWVDLLSLYFFNEHMNFWKGAGILLIICGVGVLGRVSTRS
jgi:undecaprenyl phosphate-alpha-L-ara4N flippase subunit ArnE